MNRNLILSALLSCGLSATAMAETTGGTNKDTENSTMKPTETSVKLNKAGQESSGCQVGRLAIRFRISTTQKVFPLCGLYVSF